MLLVTVTMLLFFVTFGWRNLWLLQLLFWCSAADINITRIYPLMGPDYGSTVATVDGVEFISGPELRCRFGTLPPVQASSYISSTRILCVSPPNPPATMTLEVTNNNQDYTDNQWVYTYYGMWYHCEQLRDPINDIFLDVLHVCWLHIVCICVARERLLQLLLA